MNKIRFFATLHFARQLRTPQSELTRLIVETFYYAYGKGWQDGSKATVNN